MWQQIGAQEPHAAASSLMKQNDNFGYKANVQMLADFRGSGEKRRAARTFLRRMRGGIEFDAVHRALRRGEAELSDNTTFAAGLLHRRLETKCGPLADGLLSGAAAGAACITFRHVNSSRVKREGISPPRARREVAHEE